MALAVVFSCFGEKRIHGNRSSQVDFQLSGSLALSTQAFILKENFKFSVIRVERSLGPKIEFLVAPTFYSLKKHGGKQKDECRWLRVL